MPPLRVPLLPSDPSEFLPPAAAHPALCYNLPVRYREIISYPDMLQREKISLQKGMNFRVRTTDTGIYSIVLMSVRKGAPYQDQWHEDRNLLEYEGHDCMKRAGVDPKRVDQPLTLPSGRPTDNGKFFAAAEAFKAGAAQPEIVQVYEKVATIQREPDLR